MIIDPSRRALWEGYTGIPGGIPNSALRSVFTTLAAGSTRAQVQTALDTCPANQVVELAAGAYAWTGTLDWLDVNDGVVLRGAGIGQTNVTWSSYSEAGIRFRGIAHSDAPYSVDANLSANATKDAFTLTLASVPSWVTAGDLIGVDVLDDTAFANQDGFNARTFTGNGERNMSQLNRVISKDATTITLETPNAWGWTTAQTAQIFQPGYDPSSASPLTNCGIEGISFIYSFGPDTDAHPIKMEQCDKCWIKDVEINNQPGGRGIVTYYSYQCEFRRLHIHDAHSFAAGQGYCLDINDSTCSCLIEDCIFEDYHCGVTIRYGSTANVVAYNVFKNSAAAATAANTGAMSTHGCHAMMNIWEGNWTNDKVLADHTHGSSSHNTIFRNVIEGRPWGTGDDTAVSVEYYNRYWNIVGNILGVNGLHNKYRANSSSTAPGSTGTIFKVGGEVNISDDYVPSDADSFTSGAFILTHGNWDYVNDAQIWEATIADHDLPSSYVYSSKPSYFNSLTWPPFDPSNPGAANMEDIPAGYRLTNGTDPPAGSLAGSRMIGRPSHGMRI